MKVCGFILICLVILVGTDLPAMSSKPSSLANMTCHISTPDTKGCTGIPTLRSGTLHIQEDNAFELTAHYDGCFFMEDVRKTGKFQVSHFNNTMSLELLTTQTKGVKDTTSDFPRTLGFANLNNDKLDGYFVDISAVIRGRGRETKDVITSTLQCKAYE